MKPFPLSRRQNFGPPLAIPLALAIAFGMIVVLASGLPPKWFISIALALVFLSIIFIIPRKEKLVLYASVLVLPISFDFYLINLKFLPYSLPVSGFRLTAFDLLFFVLLGFWLFRLANEPTKIRFYPCVSVPFAILLIICLFSSISSPIPGVIKVSYIWYAIENWAIFLYIANNVRDRRTIFIIVSLFLFSAVLQSFLAMAQYATGGTLGLGLLGETEKGYFTMRAGAGTINRVAGTLGHPNKLGMFLGMWLPINLSLIFAPIPKRYKCMLIPSLVVILIADILTLSRGAWLSLCAGATITLYWCLVKRTRKRILAGFLITVILGLTLSIAVIAVTPIRERLFREDYGTAHVRIPLAKLALNMIKDKPLLGVGEGAFTAVSHKYDRTSEGISYSFPAPVHNSLLLIAAELGIPALGIFLIIVCYIFINILRTAQSSFDIPISYLGVGFFGGWSAWFLQQMVDYEYILLNCLFWFTVGLILVSAQFAAKKLPSKTEHTETHTSNA